MKIELNVESAGTGRIAWVIQPDWLDKIFLIFADTKEEIWPILETSFDGIFDDDDDASYSVNQLGTVQPGNNS